jgi:hypothetical protein
LGLEKAISEIHCRSGIGAAASNGAMAEEDADSTETKERWSGAEGWPALLDMEIEKTKRK